ncbi:MAG: hypothetical protein Q4B88_02950 [Moraxella sp.]|nr:hypothetical protein [Moraxella sp.]
MRKLTFNEIEMVAGGEREGLLSDPGWGATVGGIIGGKLGVGGSSAGAAIGHAIENADYDKLGEDYKDWLEKEMEDGLIHND